jgi:hypothetical protein
MVVMRDPLKRVPSALWFHGHKTKQEWETMFSVHTIGGWCGSSAQCTLLPHSYHLLLLTQPPEEMRKNRERQCAFEYQNDAVRMLSANEPSQISHYNPSYYNNENVVITEKHLLQAQKFLVEDADIVCRMESIYTCLVQVQILFDVFETRTYNSFWRNKAPTHPSMDEEMGSWVEAANKKTQNCMTGC